MTNDFVLRRNLARMIDDLKATKGRRRSRYTPNAFHCAAYRALGHGTTDDVAALIQSYELEPNLGCSTSMVAAT